MTVDGQNQTGASAANPAVGMVNDRAGESADEQRQVTISVTPSRWFWRGFLAGMLIDAAVMALSYFFRSEAWGNLLGLHHAREEAMGFPLIMWEEGNTYGGLYADYGSLAVNLAFGALLGCVTGGIAYAMRRPLTRLVRYFEARFAAEPPPRQWQFSLRGLMIATCGFALLAAIVRQLAARPEMLGGIYLFGPWLLVLVALLPRHIAWEHRVLLLAPLALLTIGSAIYVGASLERPLMFEKVLLGIFVCWTPQSALAATGLTLGLLFAFRREMMAKELGHEGTKGTKDDGENRA